MNEDMLEQKDNSDNVAVNTQSNPTTNVVNKTPKNGTMEGTTYINNVVEDMKRQRNIDKWEALIEANQEHPDIDVILAYKDTFESLPSAHQEKFLTTTKARIKTPKKQAEAAPDAKSPVANATPNVLTKERVDALLLKFNNRATTPDELNELMNYYNK